MTARYILPLVMLLLAPAALAQDEEEQVELPGLEVDVDTRTIQAKGTFWVTSGELEFIATGEHGKLHETLTKLDCTGQDLQVALYLIGLEESAAEAWFSGSRVVVTASWEHDGKAYQQRVEELVWAAHRNRQMARTPWIFTGSRFITHHGVDDEGNPSVREVFAAEIYGNYIALYHDPLSMLDNPLKWAADDEVWYANERVLPPRGTPVTLTIQAVETEPIARVDEFPKMDPPSEWPAHLSVDREAREVVVKASFYRDRGLVTLLAGSEDRALRTSPLLTIAGELDPIRLAMRQIGLVDSGELHLFGGSLVSLTVRFTGPDGKQQSVPLQSLLKDRDRGDRLEDPRFCFVGSRMYRARKFNEATEQWELIDAPASNLFGAFISLLADANAVITTSRKPTGNWWMIDQDRVPPAGTAAEIVIRARESE